MRIILSGDRTDRQVFRDRFYEKEGPAAEGIEGLLQFTKKYLYGILSPFFLFPDSPLLLRVFEERSRHPIKKTGE
jgi:hypothetical protein